MLIININILKNKSKLNKTFNKLLKQLITIIKFLILYKIFSLKIKKAL